MLSYEPQLSRTPQPPPRHHKIQLIAAQADDHDAVVPAAPQASRNLAQQRVVRRTAQHLGDCLEAIKIEAQYSEGLVLCTPPDGSLHRFLERHRRWPSAGWQP